MRRFSIGTSLGDAFALIVRRPLAVFVWGLLMVAPVIGMFAVMLPAMASMAELTPETGEAADIMPPEFFAHMMQFQLASMLANVVQLLLMAVVYTAVMRAVLRPAEKSWFSLRVGMDELRVAVVGLAIGVGLYAILMVIVMLGVGVGFAFWGAGIEPGLGVALAIFAALALALALCWGLARVSLIAPATVLYRDFGFVQGWRLAAGKGWPLLGLMIVIILIVILIEVVLLFGGLAIASVVVANSGVDWAASAADDNPFPALQAWFAANWHWTALAAAVASAFYGVFVALSVAPFASACRQLADSERPAEASPAPAA